MNLGKLLRGYERDPSDPVARRRYQTALMRTFGYNMPAFALTKEIHKWLKERKMLNDVHIVGERKNLGESEAEMNERVKRIIKSRPLNSFIIKFPKYFEEDFFLKGPLSSGLRDMLQLRGWDIEHWYGERFVIKIDIIPMLESFRSLERNTGEIIIGDRAQRDFGAFLSQPLEHALQKCIGDHHVYYREDSEISEEKLDEFHDKMEITAWLSSRHLNPKFKKTDIEENWMFFVKFLFRDDVSTMKRRGYQRIRSDLFGTDDFHAISSTAHHGATRELNMMLRRSHDLSYVSIGKEYDSPYGLVKSHPWVLPQSEGLTITFVFQPNIELWMELLAREKIFNQWD